MSDFPRRGNDQAVRAWLEKKRFDVEQFDGWDADTLLGSEKRDLLDRVGKDEGLRLWGLLNTAKHGSHTIEMLIERGLPRLTADRSLSTTHIHENLNDVNCVVRDFGLIEDNIDSCITNPSAMSQLLVDTQNKDDVGYSSENDVETHVYNYVMDIIRGLGLEKDIKVRKGVEIVRLKPDLLLLTVNKVPILPIKVKQPQTGILGYPKMDSQLVQYMKLYRNFRGMCQVFGILTTFVEWKLLWLPDCDSYARSRILDNSSVFVASDDALVENEVSGTSILQGSNPQIHHYIASTILKAYHGIKAYPFQPLSIPQRLRACANDECLTWKRVQWQDGDQFIFNLPHKSINNFYLMEDLGYGAHGRLWIATSPTPTSLYNVFVIKTFSKAKSALKSTLQALDTNKEVFVRETYAWKTLGFSCRSVTICGAEALLIPFAVTASSSLLWNTEFLSKIEKYMDSKLINLIGRYLTEHTPHEVATIAIELLSNAKICHLDIQWTHVAVVPVYTIPSLFSRMFISSRSSYYQMRPTFIDFGAIKATKTATEAKQFMLEALTTLMAKTST